MKIHQLALTALLLSALPALAAESDKSPETVYVHFSNTDVRELMTTYSALIGKYVVMDENFSGHVSLDAGEKLVSRQKAIELIEHVLFVNGYSLIDADDDVVLALGVSRQVRAYAPPIYTDPAQMPKGERIFSYVVKLHYRSAQEVASVLSQYFFPTNMTGFTPDANSGMLVMTGDTGLVRRALTMVEAIDVPSAKSAAAAPAASGH